MAASRGSAQGGRGRKRPARSVAADPTTLAGAYAGAVRRVVALFPTTKDAAKRLGLTESQASRYARGKVPKRVVADSDLLEELMARATRELELARILAMDQGVSVDRLARSRKSERAAGALLAKWQRLTEHMMPSKSWRLGEAHRTAVAEVAAQLGLAKRTVARWAKDKRVPGKHLRQFYLMSRFWEKTRPGPSIELACRPEDIREMRHLMALARKPGTVLGPDGTVYAAPVLAPFRSRQKRTDSFESSGFEWAYHIGKMLSVDTIQQMVDLCRKSRMPNGYRTAARSWDRWMVTAVQVEYLPPHQEPGPADHSDRNIVRLFGKEVDRKTGKVLADGGGSVDDRERGRDMNINQGRSGSVQPTKALAIEAFIERMDDWMARGLCVYVQGVILRNWRIRTREEQAARKAQWQHEWIEAETRKLREAGLIPPNYIAVTPPKTYIRGPDGVEMLPDVTMREARRLERQRKNEMKRLRRLRKP